MSPKPKVPDVVSLPGCIQMFRVLGYGEKIVSLGCFDCGSVLGLWYDRAEFDARLWNRKAGDKRKRGGIEVISWYRKRPVRKPKEGAR